LASLFHLPGVPQRVQWNSRPEGHEEAQIEFSWAGEAARHVGSVVHHWLQRMAEDELQSWDAKRIDGLADVFRRQLHSRGVRATDSYDAAELVRNALKNTMADDRGCWILGPHPQARSEMRLRLNGSRGLHTYVMDRVFRDAHGERWVIDFKTSRHEGAGLEQFLDEEQKRYEPQLRTYASAFEKARLGLYFPLLRGWREWTL
jgi:ATP-dependent exoDNAse (exonuclease V) beta subunit